MIIKRASALVESVASVPSPCVSVCRMHEATGWCEGCLRTLPEIAEWSQMNNAARRAVWKLLPWRRMELERLTPPGNTPQQDPG